MALARGHAAMPSHGRRIVGTPDRPAHQAHSASSDLLHEKHLVALHGFIKKARATPDDDLALARRRKRELEQ